jgi:hypothetical protein
MITMVLPYIWIAAAMALLSSTVVAPLGMDDFQEEVRYDMTAERIYEGSVHGRPHVRDEFVYFSLLANDANIEVKIGPREFFKRSGVKLNAGEMVKVIGMPAVIKDKEIVLAREVTTPRSVLFVRDHQGRPMWETGGPVQMDPERRDEPFMVCQPLSPR